MFVFNSIANTISILNNSYQKQKLFVDFPFVKKNYQLVDMLYKLGHIQFYIVFELSNQRRKNDGSVGKIISKNNMQFLNENNKRYVVRVYLKYINQTPMYSKVRCY